MVSDSISCIQVIKDTSRLTFFKNLYEYVNLTNEKCLPCFIQMLMFSSGFMIEAAEDN